MSNHYIHGPAVRALREARAMQPATADHDPRQFVAARFAIACLISPGHLCNIEKDRKKPTPPETIQRIADQLGVPFEAIAYKVVDTETQRMAVAA